MAIFFLIFHNGILTKPNRIFKSNDNNIFYTRFEIEILKPKDFQSNLFRNLFNIVCAHCLYYWLIQYFWIRADILLTIYFANKSLTNNFWIFVGLCSMANIMRNAYTLESCLWSLDFVLLLNLQLQSRLLCFESFECQSLAKTNILQ